VNIYERAVVDKNFDEELWLAERRKGVTATEIAKLATGQKAARRDIFEEKISGLRSFTGNRYSDWGLEREIALSNRLELEFGFEASDILFFAPENSRHLATPDAVWLGEDSVKVAEIKTSKNDLNPEGRFFSKTTYLDQMQWQIYVAGETCTECLFMWEQHDDNWIQDEFGVFRPEPLLAEWVWIPRDDERIAELILIADEFLAELDSRLS
jgi:hypothetical protein